MDETTNQQFKDDLAVFANQYSLKRIKTESPHFIRDYKRDDEGRLRLVSEKAIIRALGKITKVPIGDDQECKTYDEAATFARNHWSEYFRERRARRTEAEKRGEARRQKQYREKRKSEKLQIKHNQ